MKNTGVLVGSDRTQEWCLAGWFSALRKYNPELPVAFADFGLSKEVRAWCEERGVCLDVPVMPSSAQTEEPGMLFMGQRWIQHGMLPASAVKPVWYAKPSAMALSPFERTLWLDADCEVRGDLSHLLSLPLPPAKLRARKDPLPLAVRHLHGRDAFVIPMYNGGVILFEKGSPLLQLWEDGCKRGIRSFDGDDLILSFFASFLRDANIAMSFKYNWNSTEWGENAEALIYHWQNEAGKNRMYLQTFLDRRYR